MRFVPLAVGFLSLAAVAVLSSACSSSKDDEEGTQQPISPEATPTFTGTIESLLQKRCQSCHSPGGIAPFGLMTYEEVKGLGAIAKSKVQLREMPPWGAFDDESCKVQHGFKDDLRLSDAEIAQFTAWVDAGMPFGDAAKRPPPVTFPPSGLANKTHTFTMPAPYTVEAGGKDDIRCFPVDPGFAADTWVGGVNVVPGDPRVVHHVIVYVDAKGDSTAKAGAAGNYPCFGGPGVDNPSLLLAWAPGVPATDYGDDTGLKIAKGSKLVVQVHYHPGQTTVPDQTGFEIRALPGKPTYAAQVLLLGNAANANGIIKLLPGPGDPPEGPAFKIPANAAKHTESMELVLPETVQGFPLPQLNVRAVGAHMHWAGVDMKIELERKAAVSGEAPKECLLGTPKYDFNWQRAYEYAEPIERLPVLRAGDKLRFTCTYDNTSNNPRVRKALAEQQIAAPTDIALGEETLDEMCLGVVVAIRQATLLD